MKVYGPRSPGGTRGHPCPDASRILGSAIVRDIFSIHIMDQSWSHLESGVVVANFDWLPDHPSNIEHREDGPEATRWREIWEEPMGLDVKPRANCLKVLCCKRVRPLSSQGPLFC